MAEGSGLENQRTFTRAVGSNPTLTAEFILYAGPPARQMSRV